MKNISLLFILLMLSNRLLVAQVGINNDLTPPNNSAMLDVKSTVSGFLPPRMNTTQRNNIVSPATGLVIFNTDCNDIQLFNGAGWVPIGNSGMLATPGTITGNSSPCQTSSGLTYSIATISGATGYNWTVPSGATITAGQGTANITVSFGTAGGAICVCAYNDCFKSNSGCINISILPIPLSPAPGSHIGSATQIIWNWNAAPGATGYKWNT